MTRQIERDPLLDEREDFERNVRPHVPEGMMAERLYTWPEKGEPELAGWWIIPENFYEVIEAIIEDDED